jgi:hypothetical protein
MEKEGNFCGLTKSAISMINAYKKLVEEDLASRGLDPEFTFVNFSEGASRGLHKIEDKVLVGKVLDDIASRIKKGGTVTAADVKTWIDLESGVRVSGTVKESAPTVKESLTVPAGWHPSTNACHGCILLGYARDEGRKTPYHICCEVGKPPFGLEECPLGTGPVKEVDCEHWGEDTLCHATQDTLCDPEKMERVHCPIGHDEALELIRRQAGRNPKTGQLTTEYCRLRNCPDLKKREMNNTLECSIAGNVPGNLIECPKLKPAPRKLKVIPEDLEDDEDENMCSWFDEDGNCTLTEDGDMSCADLCDAAIRKERNCKLAGPPQPAPTPPPTQPAPPPAPSRVITPSPPSHPNLQRYTVEADRQDQMAIRQMVQRGLAEDEDEAVQSCFEEGLNLFMDRIEAQVQKETEDQEVLGE